jgi:hypothetical protein
VPGQVAREFAKHRNRTLGDITKNLLDESSRAVPPIKNKANFLLGLAPYQKAVDLSEKIAELQKAFKKELQGVVTTIEAWRSDDPVSMIYREIPDSAIIDIELTDDVKKEVLRDLAYRNAHSIPPGFQDSDKPDGGVGDLLIWKAILKVGADEKRPFVFVTAEKKNDWWITVDKEPFHPRYELLDEYRRASDGQTLHIVSFSQFLTTFGASGGVIDEVRRVEDEASKKSAKTEMRAEVSLLASLVRRDDLTRDLISLERSIEEVKEFLAKLPRDGNNSLSLPWNRHEAVARRQLKDAWDRHHELSKAIAELDREITERRDS